MRAPDVLLQLIHGDAGCAREPEREARDARAEHGFSGLRVLERWTVTSLHDLGEGTGRRNDRSAKVDVKRVASWESRSCSRNIFSCQQISSTTFQLVFNAFSRQVYTGARQVFVCVVLQFVRQTFRRSKPSPRICTAYSRLSCACTSPPRA